MKNFSRFGLLFSGLLISTIVFSQDTLIMRNGNVISSKVMEVGSEEIKYKRFDNLDGPLFIVKSTDVNVIKYKNGITDTISRNVPEPVIVQAPPAPIDPNPPIYRSSVFYRQGYMRMKEKEMHKIILKVQDPEINLHVKQARFAKGMEYVGFVAIPAFAGGLIYTGYALINNLEGYSDVSYGPSVGLGLLAAATLTTSIVYKFKRRNHNDAALKIYNDKY